MFFSILIPVYNTSEYLRECLESIVAQTFTDFEVVLLDDGSTDSSPAICDEYASKYPFIRVVHKDNEGLMMTRRRGFKEAKGDFFICVDSDDHLYDDEALEKIHKVIVETGCDLAIYNYVYGEGGGRPERAREIFEYPNGYIFEGEQKHELYDKLLTTNYMNNIWIKCPSRKIVDIDTDYSVWKEQIRRAEDLFQSFPMLSNATRVGYVKDPLYYYRWAPDSISNKVKFTHYYAKKCVCKREDEYMELWNVSDDIKERTLRIRVTNVSSYVIALYFMSKSKNIVNEWLDFANDISEEEFYQNLLQGANPKKVLRYYKLVHSAIVNKKFKRAIVIMETVAFLSRMKKKLKG